MTPATWQDIRALRATPTGLAANDDARRKTFAASLRQAEELAAAARSVSYAARPLLLFYALSQAGRAMSASRLPEPWPIRGHGLGCNLADHDPILKAVLKPQSTPQGAFTSVSVATQSPMLAGPVELGALWAANPDLTDVPIPAGFGQWTPALSADLGIRTAPAFDANPDAISHVTGGMVLATVDLPGTTAAEVMQAAAQYPSLAGAIPLKFGTFGDVFADPNDVVVKSPVSNRPTVARPADMQMRLADFHRLQDGMYSFVETNDDPVSGYGNVVGYALPALAGGPSPSPLMLWWALLLGLSSLARYHPDEWVAAIDVDHSPIGVPLEQVLDVAARKVPARVWDALR
jgi:hypothetical protein